jgi:hypothetical protein
MAGERGATSSSTAPSTFHTCIFSLSILVVGATMAVFTTRALHYRQGVTGKKCVHCKVVIVLEFQNLQQYQVLATSKRATSTAATTLTSFSLDFRHHKVSRIVRTIGA